MNKTIARTLLAMTAVAFLVGAAATGLKAQESPGQKVDPLIEQLASRDVFEINAAVDALAKIGPPTIPSLIETFESENWPQIEAAIKALVRIGEPAIPALLETLKSNSPPARWSAAYALRQDLLFESLEHAESVHYALLDVLSDPDPRVRRFAAESLWKQNDENSVLAFRGTERYQSARDLIEKLRHDHKEVRLEALRALTRMAEAQSLASEGDAVSFLTEALGDTEAAVRKIAAFTLGQIGERAAIAIPELLQTLNDPDPSVRATAAMALGAIGQTAKGAVDELQTMLEDPQEQVRGAAAVALADLGVYSERVVVELREELTDLDEDKREIAALELGSVGELAGVAVPELRALMGDLSPEVRLAAAVALGRIGEPAAAAVPELTRGLLDTNAPVRGRSAQALGQMGKASAVAVPNLRKALEDRDPSVRAHAARTLGQIGFEADHVIPDLSRLLQDPSQLARKFAAEALARISVSIQEGAKGLSSKELGKAVVDLESAQRVLQEAAASDKENQQEYKNAQATVGLALDALYTEQYGLFYRLFENPWVVAILAYLIVLPAIWWLLLRVRPLWLFHINHALEPYEFAAPRVLSEKNRFKTRYVILVGFYYFHPRVLDAWVKSQLPTIRESFTSKTSVNSHLVYVPQPLDLDGEILSGITPADLVPSFSRRPNCLLIWGEGGMGKDNLAVQIAKMSMEEDENRRLSQHPMFPIVIEQELVAGGEADEKAKKKGPPPLQEVVRGQLQNLTHSAEPLSEDVVVALMKRPSILLVVTNLSEKSAATREQIRPDLPDFPANSLVVTSRLEEPLGQVMKTTIHPQRMEAAQYPEFLDAYVAAKGKTGLFDDEAYAEAAHQFARILGRFQVPALIAKLHVARFIAALEATRGGRDELDEADRPDNVPELFFSYVNAINPMLTRGGDGGLDTETLFATARVVAWECMKHSLRPQSAKRQDVLEALGGEDASARLKYLMKPLSLVQSVGATKERLRFTLELLAEYFAAMHLVEAYGGDEQSWHGFLHHADEIPGAPGSIRDFLGALRTCCDLAALQVPGFLIDELTRRIEGRGMPAPQKHPESDLGT